MTEILEMPVVEEIAPLVDELTCATCGKRAFWEMLLTDGCYGYLCDRHAEQEKRSEMLLTERRWCGGTPSNPHSPRENVKMLSIERIRS
jgi:hypothetical protein